MSETQEETTQKLNVLLVDDEQDIVSVLKHGLAALGLFVEGYTNPVTALEQYRPREYDAVVVDIKMPIMSGFEFARRIWKKNPGAVICFLSAFEISKAEVEKMFPSLKSFCFIKKPITPSELATHIRSHVEKAKLG